MKKFLIVFFLQISHLPLLLMIDMYKRLVHTSKQLQATILMTSMVLKLAHTKRQPVDTTSMTNMVKR